MKIKLIISAFIIFLNVINLAWAFPNQVIIIRHADKLNQTETGPCLSATGLVRSLAFAFYYLNKFGEPDFIFATNPITSEGKNSSLRELQTLAPLANLIAEKHTQTGFPILHPYKSSDYDALANDILNQKKYNGKNILICWKHSDIPQLAKKLGVQGPISTWPKNVFDMVWVLKFDNRGNVTQFETLTQQYPVPENNWQELLNKLSS